jgi:hypothetical protein
MRDEEREIVKICAAARRYAVRAGDAGPHPLPIRMSDLSHVYPADARSRWGIVGISLRVFVIVFLCGVVILDTELYVCQG